MEIAERGSSPSQELLVLMQWMLPQFSLASLLRRQAPICSKTPCFVVFGNTECPSFFVMLFSGYAGRQGLSCWNPAAPVFPLSQRLTQTELLLKAPAQLPSPALQRSKKRMRAWVWDGVWGTWQPLCRCTVSPFIYTTGAVHSWGGDVNGAAVKRIWL